MARNTISQSEFFQAAELIKTHADDVRQLKSYPELVQFLEGKMNRQITRANARSILKAVQDSGCDVTLMVKQKPQPEASSEFQQELLTAMTGLTHAICELTQTLKTRTPRERSLPFTEVGPVEPLPESSGTVTYPGIDPGV